jgi:hypothetical protein
MKVCNLHTSNFQGLNFSDILKLGFILDCGMVSVMSILLLRLNEYIPTIHKTWQEFNTKEEAIARRKPNTHTAYY